ncbi:hypothetical protein [Eubacterium ventriosum]|uniref:hypothetical protein n=1 Tax=Eubacterium ventriosum TaxID=39496 RepID=UPI003AB5D8B8
MRELHEITLNQMKEAISGNTYNIISIDTNALSVAFYGAVVEVDTEFKDDGEISIHKPGTLCEVKIDCGDVLDGIETDDNGYFILYFNNGLADIEITKVSQ